MFKWPAYWRNRRLDDTKSSFTHLAAIKKVISWADSQVETIYGVWNLKAADGVICEGCVINCHAGINRDMAQAQKRRSIWKYIFFAVKYVNLY